MSDLQTALHGHMEPGARHGAASAAIAIREHRPAMLVQVQSWPDSVHVAANVLGDALGARVPEIGRCSPRDATIIMTLAPGRWLVISSGTSLQDRLARTLTPQIGVLTDLGHARTVLQISGKPATFVLNKHLAIDLHPAIFHVGCVAQSMIHHVGITLARLGDDEFLLLGFRSFGLSLFETLCDSSLESGYRLEPA